MLDNKETLQTAHNVKEDACDVQGKVSVFIKVIQIRLNGRVRKHFSINKECGKTVAFLETREFAIFYCMSNNLDYCFVN